MSESYNEKEVINRGTKDFLKKNHSYHLRLFKEIIGEMLNYYDLPGDLSGKTILELGPGTKFNLLHYFSAATTARLVKGIGINPRWSFLMKTKERKNLLNNGYILPRLKSLKAKSVDLIYSRHLMEENSINPFILLSSHIFWKSIKENRINNHNKNFPSSKENILAILKESWRLLKPGALFIAQIAKDKRCPLNEEVMLKLHIRNYKKRKLGRTSFLWVIRK